jgi:hypothetical protein
MRTLSARMSPVRWVMRCSCAATATSRSRAVPTPRPCQASSTRAANSASRAVGVAFVAGDPDHPGALAPPTDRHDRELQVGIEVGEAVDVGLVEVERAEEACPPGLRARPRPHREHQRLVVRGDLPEPEGGAVRQDVVARQVHRWPRRSAGGTRRPILAAGPPSAPPRSRPGRCRSAPAATRDASAATSRAGRPLAAGPKRAGSQASERGGAPCARSITTRRRPRRCWTASTRRANRTELEAPGSTTA